MFSQRTNDFAYSAKQRRFVYFENFNRKLLFQSNCKRNKNTRIPTGLSV